MERESTKMTTFSTINLIENFTLSHMEIYQRQYSLKATRINAL